MRFTILLYSHRQIFFNINFVFSYGALGGSRTHKNLRSKRSSCASLHMSQGRKLISVRIPTFSLSRSLSFGVSYPRTIILAEIEVYTKDLVGELEDSHHHTVQALLVMVRIVLVLENTLTKNGCSNKIFTYIYT